MASPQNRPSLLVQLLLKVRPHALTAVLKTVLGIRRRVLELADGRYYWIDPVSNLGRFLGTGKEYEPQVSEVIQKYLRPGDVFLDVGANEGYFSVMAGRIVGQEGKVFAVEPQNRLREVIQRNRDLNGLGETLTHIPIGIGATEGNANLELASSVNTGASGMKRYWVIGSGSQEMPVHTLDSVIEANQIGRIRLMKVDCEGGEVGVIDGATRLLGSGLLEHLLVEYHPHVIGEAECKRLDEKIRCQGYTTQKIGEHVLYSFQGSSFS